MLLPWHHFGISVFAGDHRPRLHSGRVRLCHISGCCGVQLGTLGTFRDASNSLSTAEIVAHVIEAKGFDAGDRVLRAAIGDLVKATLNPMRRRGVVDKIGEGRGVRWKLAPREPGLI